MRLEFNESYEYLDDKIKYICPPNMKTPNKGPQQIYKCEEDTSELPLAGQPMSPIFKFNAYNSAIQELQNCNST